MARKTSAGSRVNSAARRCAVAWLTAGMVVPATGVADSFTVHDALDDAEKYVTAPLHWDAEDWLYFGGAVVAIGASHSLDARVRSHFATGANAVLNGKDRNSARDALPSVALILGTGLYAGFIRDADGYTETWRLLEAGVLSTATSEALTYAGGRERPDATTSPNQWRQGGDSFPSVHASAAFAIGMVFAESGNDEYRWVRRIVGYGVAGATGYIRVRDNVHWLSDTVAGAAIGIATARFVLNREDSPSHSSFGLRPAKDGWELAFSLRTP